jgi:hypothetical protein
MTTPLSKSTIGWRRIYDTQSRMNQAYVTILVDAKIIWSSVPQRHPSDSHIVIGNRISNNSCKSTHKPSLNSSNGKLSLNWYRFKGCLGNNSKTHRPGAGRLLFQLQRDGIENIRVVIGDASELHNTAGKLQFRDRPDWRPTTKYERRGLKLGHRVFDIAAIRK